MMYYKAGSADSVLGIKDVRKGLYSALDALGKKQKVLAVPPDFTRFHSQAGLLTEMAWEYYGDTMTDVLPALGTHAPMTSEEISTMFGKVPSDLFRVHKWRSGLATLGTVPGTFIEEITGGKLDYDWPAQVDTLLTDGGFDLILSIGQVVPHEVIGMANYNKNIFVGTGGRDGINKSHFIGAVYGMERIMGRADNPVRDVLNYASEHFAGDLPIVYVQTVIGREDDGTLAIKGLFIGDDVECFRAAAELSLQVNFTMVDTPLKKVVVYLDPAEFRSTWLGNKSIYRTRMAIADGGDLVVVAPGVKEFGEDPEIDAMIRKYGYTGTEQVLDAVERNQDLRENLGAAAHLIHGSSEGRFSITYCPGNLTREEIEGVGFLYEDIDSVSAKYDVETLKDGYNSVNGEEIFYISNPAIGLWAHESRFV